MWRAHVLLFLFVGLSHAWVWHGSSRSALRPLTAGSGSDASADLPKSWLAMSVAERKAWNLARTGPKPSRYSAQALIKERFPDGVPEYTGPIPEDEADCFLVGADGSTSVDLDCLTNLSDGSDDWLANIASIADDENFNDLPDAADL